MPFILLDTSDKLQAKKSPLSERAKTTSVEGNKSRELMSNRRITLA
ncbi:MAG: hypothetical protein ACI90R_000189 [Alteromonas macleodii]|jgi:hypothetical protein|tara:strand:- start:1069 stop:1206 length:138 start_codon:yes stop_codon:yes gene_type:complete